MGGVVCSSWVLIMTTSKGISRTCNQPLLFVDLERSISRAYIEDRHLFLTLLEVGIWGRVGHSDVLLMPVS